MIYRLLWKYFKSGLTAEYLKEQNKPITLASLMYAFTDSNGKRYYRFPKDMAIPFDRYGQMLKYLSYLSARITPENMDMIIDSALNIIQDGIGKDKNAAKVAALLYELRDRDRLIVPAQLIYDIVAVQIVREDEKPDQFDNEIHLQKVGMFMDEVHKSEFFFRLPEFQKLTASSTTSINEWVKYLELSAKQDEQIKRVLQHISSAKVPKSNERTTKTY